MTHNDFIHWNQLLVSKSHSENQHLFSTGHCLLKFYCELLKDNSSTSSIRHENVFFHIFLGHNLLLKVHSFVLRKLTVRFSQLKISTDIYACLFSRQIKAIIYSCGLAIEENMEEFPFYHSAKWSTITVKRKDKSVFTKHWWFGEICLVTDKRIIRETKTKVCFGWNW